MITLLGKKLGQSQAFLEDGERIPVTNIQVNGNFVVQVKTNDKNGYSGVQLGFGNKKNPTKALQGLMKKANLNSAPSFLKEERLNEETSLPIVGEMIKATVVFKPGDIVDISGVSKGKGFAGGVKRHHFKGGPRTHGQSDRERAPGSIGSTTTPGRVYKGKRMAGRMGQDNVTVQNLQVVSISDEKMLVKGLVPGSINSFLVIRKVGETKKFVPIFEEEVKETQEMKEPKVEQVKEEVKENGDK